jgi:hypothetical protein
VAFTLPSRRLVLVCLVTLPLLSLIVSREPSYDPTAWLIWGRQIVHGMLATSGGPSWKPLPIVFTTPFALTGSAVAPSLWLYVARLGGLTAMLATFAVTRRLSGSALSGVIAAAALGLATEFAYNAGRGDSEGLLVTAVMCAILLHLDGRRHAAFLAGAVAALMRPEVWPFWGAYGLFVLYRERDLRTAAWFGLIVVAVLAAWFVPEEIGSGNLLRSGDRAKLPVPGTPGATSAPFLFTFIYGARFLSVPVYAGAIYATVRAWRTRDRRLLVLAGASTAAMLLVAVLAQTGFTGNLRYVTLPGSILCVLAGIGLPALAADLRGRRGWYPAVAVTVVSVIVSVGVLVSWGLHQLRDEQRYGRELPALIARAGGPAAIRACPPLWSSPYERQTVAYRLDVSPEKISTQTGATRGTMLSFATSPVSSSSRLPVRDRLGVWVRRSSC